MVRIQADQSSRGDPPVRQTKTEVFVQDRTDEITRSQPWSAVVILATYRYLTEGVRVLGEAYTTYDDHGPQ